MENQKIFWGSNIKFLRARLKMSQEELAESLAIGRSKLNAQESGKTANPTAEDLLKFSTFFRIAVDTLLKIDLRTVSELKIRELEAGNDGYISGTSLRVLATTVDKGNTEKAEFVPVKARAGYSSGFSDPDYIAALPLFSLPQLDRDRKYRMFPTTGDSMLPFPENCFVIASYLQDWRNIRDGTLCIVILKSIGDDLVFKQVENHINDRRSLVLKSLNDLYQAYEVPVSDVLEIWKYEFYLGDAPPGGNITMMQIAQSLQEIKVSVQSLSQRPS